MQDVSSAESVVNPALIQDLRVIPIGQLDPPPNNVRKTFKQGTVEELATDIRTRGILQNLLVRSVTSDGPQPRFQIIAGERRWRAATIAGLEEVPVRVVEVDDNEALAAQIAENLQREDVHPLEEADGFLRMKEGCDFTVSEVAARVGREARYVSRRLALTGLIEAAREDFRQDLITLGHALEICRLAPEIQEHALSACYENRSRYDEETQTCRYGPDREAPVRNVRYLQAWLSEHVHLNLNKAPFKLDDPRLRADGLTCIECPSRSGHDQFLFSDIKETDTCLNPLCFEGKVQSFVQLQKAALEKKTGSTVALVSDEYGQRKGAKDTLDRSDYEPIGKRGARCEHAEQAVVAGGEKAGKTIWICRANDCKDHRGRAGEYYSYAGGRSSIKQTPEERNRRKQELFDIKVDEDVRKRVMKQALATYTWPLERGLFNEVAKEQFRRIPTKVQRTICEVFGWNENEITGLGRDYDAVLSLLAALDENGLGRFMMLCSFAHYGANEYMARKQDQSDVIRLSAERDINHRLIDAETRAELCAKKYRARHQAYLDAVTRGDEAEKPAVYDIVQEPPADPSPTTGKAKQSKEAAGSAEVEAPVSDETEIAA